MNEVADAALLFAAFANPICLVIVTILQIMSYRAASQARQKAVETHDAVLVVERATNSLMDRERRAAEVVAHALGTAGAPLPPDPLSRES